MINRRIARRLSSLLDESPAIALIGPRQVGKTTLALAIAEARPSIYLDLESETDRAKLAEPELYLMRHEDKPHDVEAMPLRAVAEALAAVEV